jgi:hypothetical protein
MYLTTSFPIAVFAAKALTAPLTASFPTNSTHPYNTTSTAIVGKLDANQCPGTQNHFPSFSAYEKGVNQFCDRRANQDIQWNAPLTYTITLNGHDNKPIEWVYKVTVDNNESHFLWSFKPTTKGCKDKFMALTKGEGGGLDKVYCNWDSTMLGIHDKLMLGGKYTEPIGGEESFATVTWESRPKRGQKGI